MLNYNTIRLIYIVSLLSALFGWVLWGDVFMYVFLWVSFLYLLIIIYGTFRVEANFFLPLYNKANISFKQIALTFDDGPSEHTMKVLDVLKANNIKATFFVIGEKAAQHKEILERILAEGHEIGNHTYKHSKATGFYSAGQLKKEIEDTTAVVERIVGVKMKLFRPPFGVTTPNLAKAVRDMGMKAIGWSVRSFDTTIKPVQSIAQHMLKKVKPGAVLLLHDDRLKCQEVLESIIPRLRNQGYAFVTVGDLFKIEAYEKA